MTTALKLLLEKLSVRDHPDEIDTAASNLDTTVGNIERDCRFVWLNQALSNFAPAVRQNDVSGYRSGATAGHRFIWDSDPE